MALDFDEEHALWGQDQGIDFVDGAIVGDEAEVGPGAVGVEVRELASEVLERVAFPGEFGAGHTNPALVRKSHMTVGQLPLYRSAGGGWNFRFRIEF